MTTFHTLPHAARADIAPHHGRTRPTLRSALPPMVLRPLVLVLCLVSLAGCYGGRDWHDHHHHRDGYYGGRSGGYGRGPGGAGRGW